VAYLYRYCPRCRREWPAERTSCQECCHWLGERPLERTEWQLSPADGASSIPYRYELVGANALVLRLVSTFISVDQLRKFVDPLREILPSGRKAVCGVAEQGWVIWTEGLPAAFREGEEIARRLEVSLPLVERIIPGTRLRWGIWTEQYILPFGESRQPVIGKSAARAIFNFEPDSLHYSSESVYQVNRAWEHFICAPRRLLSGKSDFAFRRLGHKRASALDHAKVVDAGTLVGRGRELAALDQHRRASQASIMRLAVVAEAGSGKTRLIKEWLSRNPGISFLWGSFSLFGGDVVSLASQFVSSAEDHPSHAALLDLVLASMKEKQTRVLILDDLHFADADGAGFVRLLVDALPRQGIFVLLLSRPSGRPVLSSLAPDDQLSLKPLSPANAHELAREMIGSERIAAVAAGRSKGNPLFVQQFAAWAAETGFQGGEDGPRNLHQLIAARIKYLSDTRLAEVRERLRWGRSWERQAVSEDLDRLETEIGLWLDRLETGDYADRVQAAQHLAGLERVDYQLFIVSMLAGKPRPRSSRLREAIERLLMGSAELILDDLATRAQSSDETERENIAHDARRCADVAYEAFKWSLAVAFYELVLRLSPARDNEPQLRQRLSESRQRALPALASETCVSELLGIDVDLESHPMVDMRRLPDLWRQLGCRYRCREYFLRAATAAEAINDRGLSAWARKQAEDVAVGFSADHAAGSCSGHEYRQESAARAHPEGQS
jgi:hypothetical protein